MTDDWEDRANALPRGDLDAVLAFVREQLEHGDITSEVVHHLAMVSGVRGVAAAVERDRAAWFRARNRNAPRIAGPALE